MKIVTGRTMAEIDRVTIAERGVPSLALMERAGTAVADELHRLCDSPGAPVLALCGKGNNGGDGFVAARRLLGRGYRPRVLLTHSPENLTPDGAANLDRYRDSPFSEWDVWSSSEADRWFDDRPVVIDALFGTGTRGAPKSPYDDLIRLSNERSRWTLAADIPSGVDAATGEAPGESTRCRATVTFGLPKAGHFLREGLDRTGSLTVADIGFPKDLLEEASSEARLITARWVADRLPRYAVSAHKGDRGKTLIVAGSPRLFGAAILAARAALAAGAGLVTLAVPESLNAVAKGAVPEAMTLPLPETTDGTLSEEGVEEAIRFAEEVDAVAIGPGLGREKSTGVLVREFSRRCPKPLVVDADGLNFLAEGNVGQILRERTAPTLLTPHPGEMARLIGLRGPNDVEADRWGIAKKAAEELESTVLLKGAATAIASAGEGLLVNRTGTPAMAQGGMGDTLTGIVAAFLGQGLSVRAAAASSAFLHGRAGEIAVRRYQNPLSISATQLNNCLGEAIETILARDDG